MALKNPIWQLQPKSPIYFKDSEFTIYDSQDESKWARFEICLFPSQATMIYRLPERCGTLMLKEDLRDWVENNPAPEEVDPVFAAHVASSITQEMINVWNEAYGWGNHADAGYLLEITKQQIEAVLIGTITSHNHDGMYELPIDKNSAFNKDFGNTCGTVMSGGDNRVNNLYYKWHIGDIGSADFVADFEAALL